MWLAYAFMCSDRMGWVGSHILAVSALLPLGPGIYLTEAIPSIAKLNSASDRNDCSVK